MAEIKSAKIILNDGSYQVDLPNDSEININSAKIDNSAINYLAASAINITREFPIVPNIISFNIGDTKFNASVSDVQSAIKAVNAVCDYSGNNIVDTYLKKTIATSEVSGGIKIGFIESNTYDKYTVNGINIGLNNSFVCIRWGEFNGPISSESPIYIKFTDAEMLKGCAANNDELHVCLDARIAIKLSRQKDTSTADESVGELYIQHIKSSVGSLDIPYYEGFQVCSPLAKSSGDYKANYFIIGCYKNSDS